jgi:hypothetical protein
MPAQPLHTVSPLALSASRATDVPACRLEWFLEALRQGGCAWRNPFNGTQTWVSFEAARVIVFWSKNFAPLLTHLPLVEARGLAPFFQFTVNDYEAEGFEPRLPPLERRIATFRELSARYGRERVVWRFDPLLLSERLAPDALLRRIAALGDRLHPFTSKLVFSFADIAAYSRVARRCAAAGAGIREFLPSERLAFAQDLAPHLARWGLEAATCCEADDLLPLGIRHSACIDAQAFLRLGLLTPEEAKAVSKKDSGQRRDCRCTLSKDIGAYRTCTQGCVYCYAGD